MSNDTSSRIHVREGSENGVYILSISDVKNGDDGSYVCRAQSGGEKETSLKIIGENDLPFSNRQTSFFIHYTYF